MEAGVQFLEALAEVLGASGGMPANGQAAEAVLARGAAALQKIMQKTSGKNISV